MRGEETEEGWKKKSSLRHFITELESCRGEVYSSDWSSSRHEFGQPLFVTVVEGGVYYLLCGDVFGDRIEYFISCY